MMDQVPEALLWGLRRYLAAPNARVVALHKQPFPGGLSGSILEYWHLHLTRAGVQSSMTLVYKGGRVVTGALMKGASQREAQAYAHLPTMVPLGMPTAIAFDIQAGDLWFLPFPASKHTSHWTANWSRQDVEKTVEDLARLHGNFWHKHAVLREWSWLMQPTGADAEALIADARAGLEALSRDQAFDDCLSKERVQRLAALAAVPDLLLAVLNDSPQTLLHGDAGFQNIAISHNGRQRLWYDWQLVAAGPPALDLVTFLHPWAYPEASPPLPATAIIHLYRRSLAKQGITISGEDLNRQLDAAFLWRWLMQWAPLLGRYRERLRPEVRQRLYHVFAKLHWPALERFKP